MPILTSVTELSEDCVGTHNVFLVVLLGSMMSQDSEDSPAKNPEPKKKPAAKGKGKQPQKQDKKVEPKKVPAAKKTDLSHAEEYEEEGLVFESDESEASNGTKDYKSMNDAATDEPKKRPAAKAKAKAKASDTSTAPKKTKSVDAKPRKEASCKEDDKEASASKDSETETPAKKAKKGPRHFMATWVPRY